MTIAELLRIGEPILVTYDDDNDTELIDEYFASDYIKSLEVISKE